MKQNSASVLERIRNSRPLILCLSNSVVQPFTANMLLAVDAIPAMLNDASEAEDILDGVAEALLINIGTLSEEQSVVMRRAVIAAQKSQTPWVLDPVAVGLLKFRTEFCKELLTYKPCLIRGNPSEIMILAGEQSITRGPESTAGSNEALDAAIKLAKAQHCTVLVTGEVDYITDGNCVYSSSHGRAIMTRVTGVGCAMGALAAACVVSADSPLEGAIACAHILGLAAEFAEKKSTGVGSFACSLLDELDSMDSESLLQSARIEQIII